MCIYMLDSLTYDNIDLTKYSKDQDLEICAIKLVSTKKFNHILSIWIALWKFWKFPKFNGENT